MEKIELVGIKFNNFKSLDDSYINFSENITGIYGENGIGKTSVVEAIEILHEDLNFTQNINAFTTNLQRENIDARSMYKKIEDIYRQYKSVNADNMKIAYEFKVENFIYTFTKEFKFDNMNITNICETVKYCNINQKSKIYNVYYRNLDKMDSSSMLKYSFFDKQFELSLADVDSEQLLNLSSVVSNLMFFISIEKKKAQMSEREKKHIENIEKFNEMIKAATIIKLNDQSLIDLGICIPINIHWNTNDKHYHGKIPVNQFNQYYPLHIVDAISKTFDLINELLAPLTSGRKIEVNIFDTRLSEKTNETEEALEIFVVQPNGSKVNIQNESAGIIKLISTLATFAELIRNDNYLLVIDELDSHVYEYLLASLISNLNDNCRGKLIFTSHNLTLFEHLEPKNISILQRDETGKCNFTNLKRPNETSNLRSMYLRALYLGGNNIYESSLQEDMLFRAITKIKMGD